MSEQKSFAERFASKKSTFTSQSLKPSDIKADQETAKGTESQTSSNQQTSAIDPRKRSQADLIYLVKGVDAGRNAWYYVLVERMKVQLFLKALNDDIIHLENYGVILYSAYGDEPPTEVTNKLKEEYGI